MRIARLALAVMGAALAMTSAVSPAIGVEVRLEDDAGGQHCGSVTMGSKHIVSGGCELHVISEVNWLPLAHTGVSEAATTTCEQELVAFIDGSGSGWFQGGDHMIHTNGDAGGPCVITVCDEAEAEPRGWEGPHPEFGWPLQVNAAGTAMTFTFCIRPFNTSEGQGNTPCTITVSITQVGHQQEFAANEAPCAENPARELIGHWVTDPTHDEVEITP